MFRKFFEWLDTPPTVYVACKMTGLFCDEMRERADHDYKVLHEHGIIVHHPVLKEGVPKVHLLLTDKSEKEMTKLWDEDKEAVRKATVLLDTAAGVYSTGAKREVGKSRYRDWTPLVTLWDKNKTPPFIARQEDDVCVNSIEEAASVIQKLWGTRLKRIAWRFPIYLANWHDMSLYKLWRFFR